MTQAKQETSTVRESQEWCRYLREKKGLVSTMPSEARNFAAIADFIETLTARNAELMDEVARLKTVNANLMGDDEDKPRYTTKRLRHEIAQATSTLTARIEALEAALKEAKSELRDMWHDHPVMVKIDAALEAAIRKGTE